ncbi:MAG: DUF2142 domain-containing protein [Lachnospiraceae bacterium]|nr:DUF2142 domain-containing protein [Lachnospiraceae bacterium]
MKRTGFIFPVYGDKLPSATRILICVIFCITTAMLAECAVFQLPALIHKYEQRTYAGSDTGIEIERTSELVPLTEEETNSILVERSNKEILSEYLGTELEQEEDDTLVEKDGSFFRKIQRTVLSLDLDKPLYVDKIHLKVSGVDMTGSGFSVYAFLSGDQKGDAVYTAIDGRLNEAVANVSKKTDKLRIELMSREAPADNEIEFSLHNDFEPDICRIAWLFVFLVTLAAMLELRTSLEKSPHWCFAIICFMMGMLIIMGIGTNQVSYDEHVHAKAAYKLSFSTVIETTESAMQMSGNLLPLFHNPTERRIVEEYEQKNHDYSWADIAYQSRLPRTEDRVYYPLAAGFFLGRLLHMSFAGSVMLAKMGNLLCYIFICFFAIKWAKRYRELVMIVALLPGNLFLASSISYDMLVNACLLLAVVLMYNEFLEPDRKLEPLRMLIMLLSFVVGCLSKPVYIVMALMTLFYGKKKFHSRLQGIIFRFAVLAIAGLMIYNIFRPTPVSGSDYVLVSNISYAGDKRNVGSSVMGQIQYIFSQPLAYTMLLLGQMKDMLLDYLMRGKGFFQYGYTGAAPMAVTYIVLIAAFILAFTGPSGKRSEVDVSLKHKSLSAPIRILTVIMCFGVTCIIWTSMYISFTSVGADTIKGVQGRYFTPLLLPLFLVLSNEKRTGVLSVSNRNRLVLGLMSAVNMIMILVLIIYAMDV